MAAIESEVTESGMVSQEKEQKTKELVTGLVLGEERTAQQSRRFLTCLPKGLLCFFIIFGSFGD